MQKNTLDALIDLVEKKELNDGSRTGATFTKDQLKEIIPQYWELLDESTQQEYEQDLLASKNNENSPNSIGKFASDVNRSIRGIGEKFTLQDRLDNFTAIELFNHNKKAEAQTIYLDPKFSIMLEKINPVAKEKNGRSFISDVVTKLVEVKSERPDIDKDDLFKVSANLISGSSTNKYGHTRSPDLEIINKNGQIYHNLLIATALYADKNLEKLNGLNSKTQKFIGGALKEAYKALPKDSSAEDISKAFNQVDINEQIILKAQREADKSIISKLTNLFKKNKSSELDSSTGTSTSISSVSTTRSQGSGNVRGG